VLQSISKRKSPPAGRGRGRARRGLVLGCNGVGGIIGILAVAGHRGGFTAIAGAVQRDALGAAIQHHGPAALLAGDIDAGIEHLRAVAVQRHDVGAAIGLALHKGVAGIDHGDVGDGGISDIDGANRVLEGEGMNLVQRQGDFARCKGRRRAGDKNGGKKNAAHGWNRLDFQKSG
jgi:hypothetical protein